MLVPFFRSAVTSLLSKKKMMLGFLAASCCIRERVLRWCI